MVALDFADSAVVAVVSPVSVESGQSAGSLLSLALVLLAVGKIFQDALSLPGGEIDLPDIVEFGHLWFEALYPWPGAICPFHEAVKFVM